MPIPIPPSPQRDPKPFDPVTVQPFVGHRHLGGTASSTRDSTPY